MYKIVLYDDAQGNCPVANDMKELDAKAETDKSSRVVLERIKYAMERIKISGTRSGAKFTKQIDGKLWELRTGDYRIFFFVWEGPHLVLLHSFYKETQKTPEKEIRKAKSEMADWIKRHGQE